MSSDAPAEEPPRSVFDKLGAALPVALTMIATAFAGMSTSEMSQAMYWRSAAAQDQGKVNDQWGLAGFKRDRSLICQTTAAQFRAAGGFRSARLPLSTRERSTSAASWARQWLDGIGPPEVALPPVEDPNTRSVLDALKDRKPEGVLVGLARAVDRAELDREIHKAEAELARIDWEWDRIAREVNEQADEAIREARFRESDPFGGPSVARVSPDPDRAKEREAAAGLAVLQADRYDAEARRYRAEATLNQGLGFLYEVRVKTSTAESDRHRVRSQNFFYAMLAAQVGATVASLGLARRRRSAFWTLAGIAGLVAVAFGSYVYLGM